MGNDAASHVGQSATVEGIVGEVFTARRGEHTSLLRKLQICSNFIFEVAETYACFRARRGYVCRERADAVCVLLEVFLEVQNNCSITGK
jgi:hypothetical protein